MNISLFTYTKTGVETALNVLENFSDSKIKAFTPEKFIKDGFISLDKTDKNIYCDMFSWSDLMIFVSACGIAVRKIAPFINDKCTDPAVICIDESGKFVIPMLSGHIGGANDYAKIIAKSLNSVSVITTATDINNKFSVDSWAKRQGFIIDDMILAKEVSAEILERDVPVLSELEINSKLPNGLVHGKSGKIGIYIGVHKKTPFEKTLRLIPQILCLGIGCKRGISKDAISFLTDKVLNENNIDKRGIKKVVSIDIKSQEKGLLEYAEENNFKAVFYSADSLNKIEGDFTASSFVESVTGVDNVCERAAMKEAESLLVKKTSSNGVTVAIAQEGCEIKFE